MASVRYLQPLGSNDLSDVRGETTVFLVVCEDLPVGIIIGAHIMLKGDCTEVMPPVLLLSFITSLMLVGHKFNGGFKMSGYIQEQGGLQQELERDASSSIVMSSH